MRLLSSLGLLAVVLLLFAPSVTAQCPIGLPCIYDIECQVPGMPPCQDCVCVAFFPGGPGMCDVRPLPESTKCDTDNTICTVEHCDGVGNCIFLQNALDCIPCDTDLNDCTVEKCDGKGACVAKGNAQPGTACRPGLNECLTGICSDILPPTCIQTGAQPAGFACGNACTEACDGNGNCLWTGPIPCPVGLPCDTKDCATTKHETCTLIEREDPMGYWSFCQCRGVLIECCDNADCPVGGPANPCMKCVKSEEEPEEVGGNCECAVGDSCWIQGGACEPDVQGQCAQITPNICDCLAP
jgi:hypothetical protein